jgi:hypothetical protein
MDDYYFCIDFNFFRFGQFLNTVDGPHKVDRRDKTKQRQDKNCDFLSFLVLLLVPIVATKSQWSCSNRVEYNPDPILCCVLAENSLRRRNIIKHKRNYANHVVVLK